MSYSKHLCFRSSHCFIASGLPMYIPSTIHTPTDSPSMRFIVDISLPFQTENTCSDQMADLNTSSPLILSFPKFHKSSKAQRQIIHGYLIIPRFHTHQMKSSRRSRIRHASPLICRSYTMIPLLYAFSHHVAFFHYFTHPFLFVLNKINIIRRK